MPLHDLQACGSWGGWTQHSNSRGKSHQKKEPTLDNAVNHKAVLCWMEYHNMLGSHIRAPPKMNHWSKYTRRKLTRHMSRWATTQQHPTPREKVALMTHKIASYAREHTLPPVKSQSRRRDTPMPRPSHAVAPKLHGPHFTCPCGVLLGDTSHPCETTGPKTEAVHGSRPNLHVRLWPWTL